MIYQFLKAGVEIQATSEKDLQADTKEAHLFDESIKLNEEIQDHKLSSQSSQRIQRRIITLQLLLILSRH